MQLLLDQGADVNKATLLGRTPLVVAAATSGTLEVIRLFLQKGADVNAADTGEYAACHCRKASIDQTQKPRNYSLRKALLLMPSPNPVITAMWCADGCGAQRKPRTDATAAGQ